MTSSTQWNKVKPWVFQGGLLVAIGVLVWFGVRPLREMITGRMNTIQQLDVMRSYRTAEVQKLPDLEKQNTLIDSYQKDVEIILSKDDLVSFIQSLEDLADREGVKLEIVARDNTLLESKVTKPVTMKDKGLTPSTPEVATPVTAEKRKIKSGEMLLEKLPLKNYIRLTLVIQAPYSALVGYLAKLETMPYALEVIGLSIKESDKEDTNASASFSGDFVQSETAQESILPPQPSSLTLLGEFDLVVYTKE